MRTNYLVFDAPPHVGPVIAVSKVARSLGVTEAGVWALVSSGHLASGEDVQRALTDRGERARLVDLLKRDARRSE